MNRLLALPIPMLFVVTMSACLLVGVGKKEYSKNYSNTRIGFFCFNAMYGFICGLMLWALSGFSLQASTFTILLGVIFGLVTMGATLFNLRALTLGSWAYTTVISSLSTIIPALSGMIFWNEKIGVFQCIGIILMVISIIFSVKRDKDEKKGGWKWLFFAIVSSVCTGLIGVLQKVHQNSGYGKEVSSFLFCSFAVLFLTSLLLTILFAQKEKTSEFFPLAKNKKGWKGKILLLTVVIGVCVALNNVINLYLSGIVESAVFFPIVNGGNLVLTVILATALYKERMTKMQYVGLLSGIFAVILLCIK